MQISIVGAGTREAFHAIQTDPQLSNRFEPAFIPRWEFNTEFLRLLASFEKMLPLKLPSNLVDEKIAIKLLSMCEGIIGELSNVLGKTVILAIKTDKEQITSKLLDSIEWQRPSERKKEPSY